MGMVLDTKTKLVGYYIELFSVGENSILLYVLNSSTDPSVIARKLKCKTQVQNTPKQQYLSQQHIHQ
jgi:hypothetical protein